MAGSWHPVTDGESRREFQLQVKHGDFPEPEMSGAAEFRGDPVIRTNYRTAAMATGSERR